MSLSSIKGQGEALKTIRAFLAKRRFPHSLLIIGAAGSGKRFASLQVAKALLCGRSQEGCDECSSCIKIDKFLHPDIKVIGKGDSNSIKIEQIRELRERISLKPYESDKKVFIIYDIHEMTEEAANAFLKTLEEPQSASFLILTARTDRFILPTILSRCQKVKFNQLNNEIIEEILIDKGFPKEQAGIVARLGESNLSWILQHKDNLVELRDVIIKALISSSKNVFRNAIGQDRYSFDEKKLTIYMRVTLSIFRDCLLCKTGSANLINIDKKDQISRLSDCYSEEDFFGIIEKIDDLIKAPEQNLNLKLVWDVFFSELNLLLQKKRYSYV